MKSYYTQTEWIKKCRDDDARGKKGDKIQTAIQIEAKQRKKEAKLIQSATQIEKKFKEPTTPCLAQCEFCKQLSVHAHIRYTDRCITCGNRYNQYSCYKSKQKTKYQRSREKLLDNIKDEYRQLAREGCRIPKELYNEIL